MIEKFRNQAEAKGRTLKEAFAAALESWIEAGALKQPPKAKKGNLREEDPYQRFQVRVDCDLAERFDIVRRARALSEMGAVTQILKRWLNGNPAPET